MKEGGRRLIITGADGVTRDRPMPPRRPVPGRKTPRFRRPARRGGLQEIEGPSAFGGSTRRFFDLLRLMSVQQFRLQYRTSLLGALWTVLRPLALFGVLIFVFTEVIPYGDDIPNYAVSLLLGIMLFQFFTDGTGTALGALVRSEPIVRKMHFPRVVIPLAVVASSAMTALSNLAVVLIFVLVLTGEIYATWLLLPLVLVALAAVTTGVALLLSALYVSIRDVGQIWLVIVRALFYATPILFPLEYVPEQFRTIVALNPLAPIFAQARIWVIQPDAPGIAETVGIATLLASSAIGIGICAIGLWLFVRQAPKVAELL